MPRGTRYRRQFCPFCDESIPVTNWGLLRRHRALGIRDASYCVGSGHIGADPLDSAGWPEGYWAGVYDAVQALQEADHLDAATLLKAILERAPQHGLPHLQETTT